MMTQRLGQRRHEGRGGRHDAFLHLDEERIAERAALQQHEIRARAHAAHADHPMRDIRDVVALEHHAPFARNRVQICFQASVT